MNSKPDLLNEWPDWFSIEKLEELEEIAAIGYTPEKIALYLDVPADLFLAELDDENSRVRYHYERGVLVNEATEAMETLRAAKEGNATQAQRLDKKRYQVEFQQLKEKIIYGKE